MYKKKENEIFNINHSKQNKFCFKKCRNTKLSEVNKKL